MTGNPSRSPRVASPQVRRTRLSGPAQPSVRAAMQG